VHHTCTNQIFEIDNVIILLTTSVISDRRRLMCTACGFQNVPLFLGKREREREKRFFEKKNGSILGKLHVKLRAIWGHLPLKTHV
jgi:hypothetical protein